MSDIYCPVCSTSMDRSTGVIPHKEGCKFDEQEQESLRRAREWAGLEPDEYDDEENPERRGPEAEG